MAKSAKKKGGGKRGGKPAGGASGIRALLGSGAGGAVHFAPLIALAALLAAPAALPLAGLAWNGFDRGKLWGGMISGIATGITGNPLAVDALPYIAAWFPSLKNSAGEFPAALIAREFPDGAHLVLIALLTGGLSLIPAIKGRLMKYEPPLLMTSLGIMGMALAFRVRIMAPMFNDMFTGILDSVYFYGFFVFALFVIVMAQWISGGETEKQYAHWGWSAAIGPIAGFWAGYTSDNWPCFLIAVILFMYCFTTNEGIPGIACGTPLIFAPLAAAKILMNGGDTPQFAQMIASLGKMEVATGLVCVAFAHMFATFSISLLPEKISRSAFYSLTALFLIYSLCVFVA